MMNYENLSNQYKPNRIHILLIGEAHPPNQKTYFYKVPEKCSASRAIEQDTSLPATIFHHYFGVRPSNPQEYEKLLTCLQHHGIFLMDMINEPLLIRDRSAEGGIHLENLEKLFSEENLTSLKKRITEVSDPQTRIIFLVPRTYKKMYRERLAYHLEIELTKDNYICWKDFRLMEGERISCL
jgi:hypothetical protein